MKAAIYQYNSTGLVKHANSDAISEPEAQLLLCFGAKSLLQDGKAFEMVRQKFPGADIAICSTSGEIYNTEVSDNTISMAAMQFSKTQLKTGSVKIEDYANSYDAGVGLISKFNSEGLSYLLVLSDGSKVNGSELVRGLNHAAGNTLLITGGLAGDGSNFHSTLVGLNGVPVHGLIAGIGFYGNNIHVNHGSQGGWEMFGLEKTVTRSISNVLYEIDDKNALELYKKYLGNEADSLPGSALLFPLAVILPDTGEQVVRTILSINEEDGSMTFAGDIPQGAQVRFMKANFDKITNAASGAALQSLEGDTLQPKIAYLSVV